MFHKILLNFLIELESFLWEMLPCREAHLLPKRNTVGRQEGRTERAEADFSFLKSRFPNHNFTESNFSDLSFNCPTVHTRVQLVTLSCTGVRN